MLLQHQEFARSPYAMCVMSITGEFLLVNQASFDLMEEPDLAALNAADRTRWRGGPEWHLEVENFLKKAVEVGYAAAIMPLFRRGGSSSPYLRTAIRMQYRGEIVVASKAAALNGSVIELFPHITLVA